MKKASAESTRREFLKKVGLGSMALAALPTAGHMLAQPAEAARPQINFHFLALSTAGKIDGIQHDFIMGGHGHFNSGNVVGNGSFQHQNTAPPGTPKPILGEGTWKAKRLVSWEQIGTYGDVGVAGVLVMEIDLVPNGGPAFPATLEVTCNIPPAGLFTGNPEGYVLDVPGGLRFKPFGPPPMGITWFTSAVEPRGGGK